MGLLAAGAASAGMWVGASVQASADHCSRTPEMSAEWQDRRLQFAEHLHRMLDASGAEVAVVARNGLDLRAIGQPWSHAGISLRAGAGRPWSVRQLYYACDERRPRLFDQGLAGFVFGIDVSPTAEVVAWLLPPGPEAESLAHAARDTPRALGLLAAQYSANAHAFSTQYQNCNQWLVELIGTAWGGLDSGPALRERAQAWLAEAGYPATRIALGSPLWLAMLGSLPMLHTDDHPASDRGQGVMRVSLPQAIGEFITRRVPGTQRLAACQVGDRVVVRRDGPAFDARCSTVTGDDVHQLE